MPASRNPWHDELDRLEAEVHAAEALLASLGQDDLEDPVDTTAWTPTLGLGPLPNYLLPRAEEILGRQRQVQVSLSLALAANTRQRGFAARVTDATANRAAPAYLDVTA